MYSSGHLEIIVNVEHEVTRGWGHVPRKFLMPEIKAGSNFKGMKLYFRLFIKVSLCRKF